MKLKTQPLLFKKLRALTKNNKNYLLKKWINKKLISRKESNKEKNLENK